MPQITQKPTTVLNKGLITEAGELTFPEGATVAELNMSLERDGSRRRRLGMSYETGFQIGPQQVEEKIVSVHLWDNVGNVAGLNFVVVQIGGKLYFYKEGEGPLSSNKKTFEVELWDYNRKQGFGASTRRVDTTVIEGILVVASSEINTIKITYDDDTDSISVEEIKFRIRDFDFQGDVEAYQTPSSDLEVPTSRKYDTYNAGWTTEPLETYLEAEEAYPPLNLSWFAGKDADGNFSVEEFKKVYTGTSLLTNGRVILDLYDQDRETVSGVAGFNEVETSRFKTVTTYAGRVFYAGMSNKYSNKVFFSKLLNQTVRLGDCYQSNDPTSEDISDLLDTDGGVINVQGAYNIQKLHVLGPYLIIFAENGVWTVNGVDNVFRATEFAVNKITEAGIAYSGSFVSAQGRPYWWSESAIHTLSATESGSLQEQNLSLNTIQTLWGNISGEKKNQVVASYDEFNQRVVWCYPDNETEVDFKINNLLFFDENLGAFAPWRVEDSDPKQYILAPFYLKGKLTGEIEFSVIDSEGNLVKDSSGNQVVITKDSRKYTSSELMFLVRDSNSGTTFGAFTDTDFLDWGEADYKSYLETGYDFQGDMTLKKSIMYVTPYFKVTEEAFREVEDGYELIRPSGCLLSTYWDFKVTTPSGFFTTAQQAYRLKNLPTPSSSVLDYPTGVVITRLRVRGRGRSLRLRFESEKSKDFHLLGYETVVHKSDRL